MTQLLYRHLPESPDVRFRAQLVMYILVAVLSVDIAVFLFFVFFAQAHMDPDAWQVTATLIGCELALMLGLLGGLLRGYLKTATVGAMLVTYVSIGGAILCTGGAPYSPALPSLLVAAVLTFCLLGPRFGTAFVVLAPSAVLFQWYGTEHWGWQLPLMQSHLDPRADILVVTCFNFFIVLAVLMAYERINSRLRAALAVDRQRLADLASLDDLTGLGNRRKFQERLAEACARCDRGAHQLAVLYLDLNGFKAVNDTHGHLVGDHLLVAVAQRLRGALRAEDFVARLGGDEFAVILEPVQTREGVAEVEEKIRQQIGLPIQVDGLPLSVGASIGVALYPVDTARADNLLRQADAAMYREKRSRVTAS